MDLVDIAVILLFISCKFFLKIMLFYWHSCGWIKTEVFKNDYNMVLDTSKKIMSMLPSKMVPFSDSMGFLGGSTIIKECNVWTCILFIYLKQKWIFVGLNFKAAVVISLWFCGMFMCLDLKCDERV